MKKWCVYELVNLMGTVEWVGETTRYKRRMYEHTKIKPKDTQRNGYFYGRQDIMMNIVHEFDNRKDALELESELKTFYGLPLSEKEGRLKGALKGGKSAVESGQLKSVCSMGGKIGGKIAGKLQSQKEYICPNCNRKGRGKRFVSHIKNCKI
jgi:predicted GIY-YIG superfamily endonuclease